MALPDNFHVKLEIGGVEYYWKLANPGNYLVSDLSPFTHRSTNGNVTISDYAHLGAFEQRSFHGGMGQYWMNEDHRYRRSDHLDTRLTGTVTLWQKRNEAATLTGELVTDVISVGNHVYIATQNGLWLWDAVNDTLTDIRSPSWMGTGGTGTQNIGARALFYNGQYIFAAPYDDKIYRSTHPANSGSWTPCFSSYALKHYATKFIIHDGYIWYVEGDFNGNPSNLLHYSGRIDLDDVMAGTQNSDHPKYDATDGDPSAVIVGPPGVAVKNLIVYNNELYAFRNDGIWVIRLEPNKEYVAYRIHEVAGADAEGRNFEAVAVWNGAMFFNVERNLYRWTGGTFQDVTPPPTDDGWPPDLGLHIKSILPVHDHLYGMFDHELRAFDGAAWHSLDSTEFPGTGFWTDILVYNNKGKLISVNTNGVDTKIFWWELRDKYPRGPYSTRGNLYTSWFDGGFINIPKHWIAVHVMAHIPGAEETITVKAYSREGDVQTTFDLGTISSADGPATVTSDDSNLTLHRILKTLTFPDSARGKQLVLKFTLESSDGAASPVFMGYALEYALRPETVWGYRPILILSDNMKTVDGRPDPYPGVNQKLAKLEEARNQVTPLAFEDFMGHTDTVWISAIRERPTRFDENGRPVEYEISLSLTSRDPTADAGAKS